VKSFPASLGAVLATAIVAASAAAQTYVYEQPVAAGGGVRRASQLWIDPTGQNDSDNDAIAWEDFQLAQDTLITHVRWAGDAAPALGFELSFFRQDPNTIAVQPDIFAPGSEALGSEVVTSFAASLLSAGLYQFEAQLAKPVLVRANTRYFISVVGRMPLSYVSWGWAQSSSGPNGTFWWQRGAHMYFHLGDSRALSIGTSFEPSVGAVFCAGDGASGACPCGNTSVPNAGCANSRGEGATLLASGSASVAADDLLLVASGLPKSQSCLVFLSASLSSGAPFGDGRRCVAGAVSRLGVRSSGPAGVAIYGPGLANYSQAHFPASNRFLPGALLGFQCWYRDPIGPCGNATNLSSARAVTFAP
jgi:hypothetical protein